MTSTVQDNPASSRFEISVDGESVPEAWHADSFAAVATAVTPPSGWEAANPPPPPC